MVFKIVHTIDDETKSILRVAEAIEVNGTWNETRKPILMHYSGVEKQYNDMKGFQ